MGVESVQHLKKDGNFGRRPNKGRKNANWWRNVYDSWEHRFHIVRKNFNFFLNIIEPYIEDIKKYLTYSELDRQY